MMVMHSVCSTVDPSGLTTRTMRSKDTVIPVPCRMPRSNSTAPAPPAGLVADRAAGTRRIYQIQPQGMRAIHAYLDQMWGQAPASFHAAATAAAATAGDERQEQP
jgi:hypothetical protein